MQELSRTSKEDFQNQPKTPIILVLENIRSALNVGSAFRTADAFALEKIYLCGITATPPHREILKTALGATESVSWEFAQDAVNIVKSLREEGWEVWAVEQVLESVPLHEFVLSANRKIALVYGNEVDGVEETTIEACTGALEIPQFGTKHSLNVAVCVGITTWEIVKQLKF